MRFVAKGFIKIEIFCWFLRREENRRTPRKTVGATRHPTTNLTRIWHLVGMTQGWNGSRAILLGGERSHYLG